MPPWNKKNFIIWHSSFSRDFGCICSQWVSHQHQAVCFFCVTVLGQDGNPKCHAFVRHWQIRKKRTVFEISCHPQSDILVCIAHIEIYVFHGCSDIVLQKSAETWQDEQCDCKKSPLSSLFLNHLVSRKHFHKFHNFGPFKKRIVASAPERAVVTVAKWHATSVSHGQITTK